MTNHTTLLFDIDGTLVDTHGAGRTAFMHAVCEALNIKDDLEYVSFAGATDLNIFRTICKSHGKTSTPEIEQHFFSLLEKFLSTALNQTNVQLLPGVANLLKKLAPLPNTQLGLLTGNAEHCAFLKLAPHNLEKYFSFGAYGNEFALRPAIARKACERASLRNPGTKAIVLGDTPLDILAAHAINAPCIAVATGRYSENDLRAAQADYVLSDLSDTQKILQIIHETSLQ